MRGVVLSLLIGTLLLLVACAEETAQSSAVVVASDQDAMPVASASYVGSEHCARCHETQYERWRSSHHFAAMQPIEGGSNVGDFDAAPIDIEGVRNSFTSADGALVFATDDETGELRSFPVRYTFGKEPLQQYLVEFPNGRMQASALAWDSRPSDVGGERWFHLQPDSSGKPNDVLHWSKTPYNWNTMCADCHSTGVTKGYDPVGKTYDTRFAEVTVGCEACHGPASAHVENPSAAATLPSLVDQPRQINSCAPCHSRRSQLAEGFQPDKAFLDYYSPALLDAGLYHADGQILDEVYVYGSFLQSKMHDSGVACSNCHDAHSGRLLLEGDAVCTQCHNETGRREFPELPLGRFDASEHHFHATESAGARCVNCHMPTQTYMTVDERHDHSFRIPRPELSARTGAPSACTSCHTDQSAEWAANSIAEHHKKLPEAHYSTVLAAARLGEPAAEAQLAALAQSDALRPIVRATLLSLSANYDRGDSSDAIRRGLRDPAPLVRIGALRGAARWPAAERWKKTRHLLKDNLLAVRSEAARVLAEGFSELSRDQQRQLLPHIEEYRKTLLLNADRAEAQSNIAALDLAQGNIIAAEQALNSALALNPQWVPALVNLADLYRDTNRDALGGALLEKALTVVPESPDVALAKGFWLVRQRRTDEALVALERAWSSAPEVPRYAYTYAIALNSLGEPTKALEVIDAQLKVNPSERTLLEAGFGIARDSGLAEKALSYQRRLSAN